MPCTKVKLNQNQYFASVNAFKEELGSRRDDIIMLIYGLMYLMDKFQNVRRKAK